MSIDEHMMLICSCKLRITEFKHVKAMHIHIYQILHVQQKGSLVAVLTIPST